MTDLEFARHAIERAFPGAIGIELTPFSGGVSSDCVKVTWSSGQAVVKRALANLKVDEKWESSPDRILAEADALSLFKTMTPAHVPAVLAHDDDALVIVLELAPPDWHEWRALLLQGECDQSVGRTLGQALSTWHKQTRTMVLPERLEAGKARLYELRVAPFHLDLATRWIGNGALLRSLADELMESSECLVHGDFSPKNVLHGPSGTWVIDAEVAHRGAPVLDLAFLAAHLLIKATHLPQLRDPLHATLRAFLDAYTSRIPKLPNRLAEHSGAVIGVRIDGKSRTRYLSDESRDTLRLLAMDLLQGRRIEEVIA
jgi:tRNA A-37 threonylcarbamoyl transferase component Bud32